MSVPYTFVNGAGNKVDADQVNANFAAVEATAAASGSPIGSLVDYAGSGDPADWMLCDGRAISRTVYSALFTALGTVFGAGDGSATFNIPDLRGRVALGTDNMGSAAGAASRLPNTTATRGAVGGEEQHLLNEAELGPAGNVNVWGDHGGGQLVPLSANQAAYYNFRLRAIGGTAHNNVQPYQAVNKIIRVL